MSIFVDSRSVSSMFVVFVVFVTFQISVSNIGIVMVTIMDPPECFSSLKTKELMVLMVGA